VGEFVAQYFIVELGGDAFRTYPLTFSMHLTCYVLGFGTIIVGTIGKCVPISKQEKFRFNLNEKDTEESVSPQGKKGETAKLLDK
jgi:hypothetical protein